VYTVLCYAIQTLRHSTALPTYCIVPAVQLSNTFNLTFLGLSLGFIRAFVKGLAMSTERTELTGANHTRKYIQEYWHDRGNSTDIAFKPSYPMRAKQRALCSFFQCLDWHLCPQYSTVLHFEHRIVGSWAHRLFPQQPTPACPVRKSRVDIK
jgi:hypothetical protein